MSVWPSGHGHPTYYVDAAHGSDSNSGASPTSPFRTLAAVGRHSYRGGEKILLRGGQRFAGSISLGTGNLSGTSRRSPLTISSYGGGRATILAPPGADGIAVTNRAGVVVSDLNIVGARAGCGKPTSSGYRYGTSGIRFAARSIHGTLAQGITIKGVDVSRFCDGIVVASGDDGSRISHIRIIAVSAHDNADAGIWTDDQANARHSIRDVTVSASLAYRNAGRGGIMLFGLDGGVVERSVAFDNGRAAAGSVGIWAFDSNRILFAHDESYGNGSPRNTQDGDGFDFDRGVSNSLMEDNYSHGNGGIGFLVCSCSLSAYPFYHMRNDVLRSNVSQNDGSSGQPSLFVYGGEVMTGIQVVSNRVSSASGAGPLVEVIGCVSCQGLTLSAADYPHGRPYTDVRFRGNTFISSRGKPLLQVNPGSATKLVFQGDSWRSIGGRFLVTFGGHRLRTPAAWRAVAPNESAAQQ
jgi:Right handed beta helix region